MSTTTTVVHCKKEEYDVYIGRGSIWENPFEIGPDDSRSNVIESFRMWFLTSDQVHAKKLRNRVKELKGKRLGCCCSSLPCHGDILAMYAEYWGQ